MTIVLLVEGDTEAALKPHLKTFLDRRAQAAGKERVRLEIRSEVNRKPDKLGRRIGLELEQQGVTAVVGLIDVFPRFRDAAAAKGYLREAAGNRPSAGSAEIQRPTQSSAQQWAKAPFEVTAIPRITRAGIAAARASATSSRTLPSGCPRPARSTFMGVANPT